MSAVHEAAVSDHPFVDPAVRAQYIRELPIEPALAIERLSMAFESLSGAGLRLDDYAQAIGALDEAAQPHLRRLVSDFLALGAQPPRADALWRSVTHFLTLDLAAVAALLQAPARGVRGVGAIKEQLPAFALRSIRLARALVKWRAMRYGPSDALPWRHAAFAYALAIRSQFVRTPVKPYARLALHSTAELEFKRLLALAASSPGSLPIEHLEAMDRVIAQLAHRFTLQREPAPGRHYWIDLERPKAPARYSRALDPRDGLRFIGGLDILPELDVMAGAIGRGGAVSTVLGTEALVDAHDLAAVIAHLRGLWSLHPPMRRHPHRAVRTRMYVVRGFDNVLDTLVAAEGSGATSLPPAPAEAQWATLNVSAGGFAAVVSEVSGSPLKVDELVAVRAEGTADWRVGMVRRLDATDARAIFVAVECLQGRPSAAELCIHAHAEQAMRQGVAILAGDAQRADDVYLIVRGGTYAPDHRYLPEALFRKSALVPRELLRRGPDYELVRCQVTAA